MGLTLGVAAALCWSALDVVRKAVADKASPTGLAVVLLVGQIPFLGLWAVFDETWVVRDVYWMPALVSMAMNALASVLFMRSLQLSPLSRTVPFLALAPVFGALVAVPLLRESPGAVHSIGIALVVLGAFVLNSDLSSSWWRTAFVEPGVPYMVGVAFLWSSSLAFDKVALPHASAAAHAFVLTCGSSALLLGWVSLRGELGEVRTALVNPPPILLIALVGVALAAVALQMLSLRWLLVAVVETLKRGIGVLASILFGNLFFGEPITVQKLVAGALMAVGTVVLVLL